MRFGIAAALVLILVAGTALADDVVSYDADGDADASLADPRTAALDDAFANAVNSALNELVDEDARTAHRADLDKEIVGRARLWVAKFTVTKEGTSGDRKQLSVAVRVDRDKMLARLEQLGVPTKLVAVALRVQEGESTRATFGQGGEKDVPGLDALASTLRAGGWAIKRAPMTGAAAKGDGALPLGDDEAMALGGEAHADVVAIASATVSAPVPVRGLNSDAVAVTATVRLVDRKKHEALGQGTATVGARLEPGADVKDGMVDKAVARALAAAAADVVPQGPQTIASAGTFSGSDTPIGEAGTVLVRLAPKTPWGYVSAELKYLQGAKGIKSAVLRRLSPGGWVIGVGTAESIEKIASIAKKPPTADATVKVKIANDVIDVTLGAVQ
ncbi:MAG TPA: hypothetical protein VGM39_13225 [Kofleriaceae bacterium]